MVETFLKASANPDLEPAQQISVSKLIQQDVNAIAGGMSALTPGDNVIANELIRTISEPMYSNGTATTAMFYDNFVASLGSATMNAKNELKAAAVVKDKC